MLKDKRRRGEERSDLMRRPEARFSEDDGSVARAAAGVGLARYRRASWMISESERSGRSDHVSSATRGTIAKTKSPVAAKAWNDIGPGYVTGAPVRCAGLHRSRRIVSRAG